MKQLNKELRKVHPQARRGIKLICLCILELVIKKEGELTVVDVEEHTGLKTIGLYFIADLLKILVNSDILFLNVGLITGDVKKLTEIVEQEKTKLPGRHNKLWSEADIIQLAELQLQKMHNAKIGKKMNRTEGSIGYQSTMLRKAYALIPIIEKNKTVREFVSQHVSPNPAD